jgi:hypothetical protein
MEVVVRANEVEQSPEIVAAANALGGALRHRFGKLLIIRIPGAMAQSLQDQLPGQARLLEANWVAAGRYRIALDLADLELGDALAEALAGHPTLALAPPEAADLVISDLSQRDGSSVLQVFPLFQPVLLCKLSANSVQEIVLPQDGFAARDCLQRCETDHIHDHAAARFIASGDLRKVDRRLQ